MLPATATNLPLNLSHSISPFFIVGSERSGTTLLMAILGHHSRVAIPEAFAAKRADELVQFGLSKTVAKFVYP